MLIKRVASAAVLLGLVAGGIALGGVPLDALVAVAAALAAYEAARLWAALGEAPVTWLLYPLAVVLSVRFALPSNWPTFEISIAAVTVVGLAATIGSHLDGRRVAATILVGVYTGGLLGYFLGIFGWVDAAGATHTGLRLVGIALGGAIITDTAAYFVGSAIGRHRFFPSVSPKKSVEGAVGGMVVCVAAVTLAGPALAALNTVQAMGLGLAITVMGQTGDLAESALKRSAGLKDSSQLIPGHGGLLDRLDSLLFVAPAVYCYLKVIAFP